MVSDIQKENPIINFLFPRNTGKHKVRLLIYLSILFLPIHLIRDNHSSLTRNLRITRKFTIMIFIMRSYTIFEVKALALKALIFVLNKHRKYFCKVVSNFFNHEFQLLWLFMFTFYAMAQFYRK